MNQVEKDSEVSQKKNYYYKSAKVIKKKLFIYIIINKNYFFAFKLHFDYKWI